MNRTKRLTLNDKPLSVKKQQIFLYDLHIRLKNKTTLISALQGLCHQENKKTSIRLHRVILAIKNGESLSQALRLENLLLTEIVNLIESGEKTHNVQQALILSDASLTQIEKRTEMLRNTLSYPIFLFFICLISLGFATYLLLPQLKVIALSISDLPVTTQFLLFLVSLSVWQWLSIGLIITVVITCLFIFRHSYLLSKCLLKMGVIGKILLYQDLACFCHHMSACMKIQLNIPQALKQSSNLFNTTALKHHSPQMVTAVLQGKSLSDALTRHPFLPNTIMQTIDGVRGQTHLGDCFVTLALHFEELGKRHMQRIQPFIEPLLTLMIGMVIAIFIHAIILPIYDVSAL